MYIYIYVWIHMYICIYTYMYLCVFVYTYFSLFLLWSDKKFSYQNAHTHTHFEHSWIVPRAAKPACKKSGIEEFLAISKGQKVSLGGRVQATIATASWIIKHLIFGIYSIPIWKWQLGPGHGLCTLLRSIAWTLTAGTQPRDWPVSETGQARRWAKSSACQDLTLGTEAYCHQFQPNEFMLLKILPTANKWKKSSIQKRGSIRNWDK